MTLKDSIFILLLVTLVFLWISRRSKDKGYSQKQGNFFYVLWVYHLGIGYLFYRYLLHYGGDSLRYWNLQSIAVGESESWMAHWGVGTAFVQWVNFPFSHWLGLDFLSGTVAYATLSFVGFLLLTEWMADRFRTENSGLLAVGGSALLFLPNVHFWTTGVGKEAFLWLGLILVLVGAERIRQKWWYLVLGLLLSLMVRPIQGLLLCVAALGVLPFHPELRDQCRRLLPLAAILIVGIGAYRWIQGSLQYGFHFRWIGELLSWQQQYLKSFGGNSSLPMSEYSLPEKLAAVFFRPYPWEAEGFWSVAASLENTLFFLVLSGGCWAWYQTKERFSVPVVYRISLVYGLLLSLLFAFSLNNLGIFMRMKSIYSLLFICFFYERMVFYWSPESIKG